MCVLNLPLAEGALYITCSRYRSVTQKSARLACHSPRSISWCESGHLLLTLLQMPSCAAVSTPLCSLAGLPPGELSRFAMRMAQSKFHLAVVGQSFIGVEAGARASKSCQILSAFSFRAQRRLPLSNRMLVGKMHSGDVPNVVIRRAALHNPWDQAFKASGAQPWH